MKVQLREVLEHGHERERVILDVLEDANLQHFLLFDTTYNPNHTISNKLRHSFWLPKQAVKKGDSVVIYTKKRTGKTIANSNGSTTYVYYWGLDSNVWNDDGDAAVLFEIGTWKTLKAKP